MRVIADTSAVIDPSGFDWPKDADVAVSTLTLAELGYGVVAARDDATRARRTFVLQRARAAFDPLPVDASVAEAYVMVATAARIAKRGSGPRAFDLLIAATALAHDVPLFTRDLGDFLSLRHVIDVRTP